MEDMLTYISATDLKRRVAEILNLVYFQRKTAIIERYGRPLVKIVRFEQEAKPKNARLLLNDYFGSLPDFPEVVLKRKFRSKRISL